MDLVVVLIHQCLAEYSACAMQAGSIQPGLQLSGWGCHHTHGAARVVCLYTGGCGCPMQLPGNQSRLHPDKLFGTGFAGVSKTLDCIRACFVLPQISL